MVMMILKCKSCWGGYDGNHEDKDEENKGDADNAMMMMRQAHLNGA